MRRLLSGLIVAAIAGACAKTETLELGGSLGLPELIDFGECPVGVTCTPGLSVTNEADAAITIQRIDSGDAAAFQVVLAGGPKTLRARESMDLLLLVTPRRRMERALLSKIAITTEHGTTAPDVAIRGVAGLDVEPSPLDLGSARGGELTGREFLIRNVARETLTVFKEEPSPPSPGRGSFELMMPFNIIAGHSDTTATAIYTPSSDPFDSGLDSTTWTFRWCTDDALPCETSVDLTGLRFEPEPNNCMRITPASVDFGDVPLGEWGIENMVISNDCERSVSLIDVQPDVDRTGAFAATIEPLNIPAGGTYSFQLIFTPREALPYVSGLRLVIDSRRSSPPVPIRGAGVEATRPCVLEEPVTAVDFGKVEVLRERTVELVLRNAGDVECVLGPLSLADNNDGAFRVITVSSTIAAGESGSVVVGFRAESAGRDTAALSFRPTPAGGLHLIELAATGETEVPTIYPNAIDFGAVAPGCGRVRTIRVANHRDTQLEIGRFGLSADSSADFSLVNTPLPPILPPNAELSFDVRYDPSGAVADSGAVQLFEVGAMEPYTVQLFGREGVRQSERFDVPQNRAVDVIFAFDVSGSMIEESAEYAANFPSYLAYADASGYDDQITFLQIPQRLLESTVTALRAPEVLSSSPRNLRRDAELSVVFVSDEDDQSASSVRSYADYLLSIHGARDKNALRFQTVTGGPAGCSGDNGLGQASPRWTELSLIAPGAFESICADFAGVLDSLVHEAYSPRSIYLLENQPLGAIQVLIDGVELPMFDADAQRNWTGDTTNSAVIFSPGHEPEPGVEVEIIYPGICE